MSHNSKQIDLAAYGFASGNGFFYCNDCKTLELHPGHRHSFRCSDHALKARQLEMSQLPPAEVEQLEVLITCSQAGFFSRLFVSISLLFSRKTSVSA
jgi:hypothetical protein